MFIFCVNLLCFSVNREPSSSPGPLVSILVLSLMHSHPSQFDRFPGLGGIEFRCYGFANETSMIVICN